MLEPDIEAFSFMLLNYSICSVSFPARHFYWLSLFVLIVAKAVTTAQQTELIQGELQSYEISLISFELGGQQSRNQATANVSLVSLHK